MNLATEPIVKGLFKLLTIQVFMNGGGNLPSWSEDCDLCGPNQELCLDVCSLLPSQ